MYILIGIVFIIIGLLMIFFPSIFYTLTQSWKSSVESEPSTLYITGTRLGGICFSIVGILAIIAQWLF